MNPKTPSDFPTGVIDIFKLNKIFDLNIVDCLKKGQVECTIVSSYL